VRRRELQKEQTRLVLALAAFDLAAEPALQGEYLKAAAAAESALADWRGRPTASMTFYLWACSA
jgi:hypothetical protein